MIVYIPPAGKPALISIPRDSYLAIPNHGKNKVNAAYALGGPKLLEQTVEQNTGLRIDGYLEIGFGGFVNVVDAVGGVEMCLPTAIKDRDSHIDLPKGCQTLNGVKALGYVRMRKADPRGDLGRVERQRADARRGREEGRLARNGDQSGPLLEPVQRRGQAVTLGPADRLAADLDGWPTRCARSPAAGADPDRTGGQSGRLDAGRLGGALG